jgi:Flp pilus assembly protein TadG
MSATADRLTGRGGDRALRDRAGVAALEFALIAPVMMVFLVGLVDITQALITYRRVTTVAQQTAEIVTELAENPDATEAAVVAPHTPALSVAQLNAASTLLFAVFPELRSLVVAPSLAPYAVTVSEVVFTGLPTGCTTGVDCTTYTANLAWSVPLSYGQQIVRSCGTLTQVTPATKQTLTNIPTSGMTALQTATVVDVSYNYTPIFGKFLAGTLGKLTFKRTAMVPARNFPLAYIVYDTYGNSHLCGAYQ